MNRREFFSGLASVGVVVVAGCGGGAGDDSSSGGSSNPESTETERTQFSDVMELVSHEFRYSSTGLQLYTTVQNVSDSEIPLTNIQSNLYAGNRRVGNSSMNVSGLPSGIEDTAEMTFFDAEPRQLEEVTNYDITIEAIPDDGTYERRFEFDSFSFPPEN